MLATIEAEPLPSFAIGDVPSTPLTIAVDTGDEWVTVISPAAAAVISPAAGTTIEITLPVLTTAGVLTIPLTLSNAEATEAVEPVRIVVEDPSTQWHTLGSARTEWADAPEHDIVLFELLNSARTACQAFAPAVETIPPDYRKAQLLQARGVWAASSATGGDRIGDDEHGVTVFPLDWNVKQLLRPKSALGGMF